MCGRLQNTNLFVNILSHWHHFCSIMVDQSFPFEPFPFLAHGALISHVIYHTTTYALISASRHSEQPEDPLS